MKIRNTKARSTHNAMLIKAVLISEGSVVEVGAGFTSTPLLHWLCKMTDKDLITYENNQEYFEFAKQFQSRHHRIRLAKDWDDMDFETRRGVVFIDHAPAERRIVDILKFKDIADYIVVHDTEREDAYGYNKVWPYFKYRFDWKECKPYTTVVSNFKSLKEFEHKSVAIPSTKKVLTKFTKYHKHGAYHWKQYEDKNTKYSRHADRVKEWIKEKNVLDIGAGDGKITSLLGAKGIDNEPKAVELARERGASVIFGCAYRIPYKNEEFDSVFMGDTLEHLEFPKKALQEAKRVLKDYLYIASPEKGTNSDPFHYEEWTSEELKTLIEGEGFELEGKILEVPKDKRIYGKFKKVRERDLSILIPARNEMFLARTIEDILKNIEADTEVIAVLDGQWADPPIKDNDRVNLIYVPESIGQRAATNLACKSAQGKYVMKVDAHCSFDKGFDRKMLEAFKKVGDEVTMVPIMRNLWAFDWKCYHCGWKKYQGPTPEKCEQCGKTDKIRRKMLWIGKERPQSTSYCFDAEPHFQYFREYAKRPEYKRDLKTGLTETMSLQGSCFMLTRKKYWELNICDESFGSWGNQGIEAAVKTWLSGGRVLCNHSTWYAHMFRTQGGDFGFPYGLSGREVQKTKGRVKDLFWEGKYSKQVRSLSWLVERFWPVPGWTDGQLKQLKRSE